MQIIYQIIYNRYINYIFRNINKFLSPILPSKIKLPPSGVLSILLKNKTSIALATNQTNYLTYCMFWDGTRNFEYNEIFIKLTQKTQTFFDIGANIGYYSMAMAKLNPSSKVYSFEPAIGPSHYLKFNKKLNNLANISIHTIALSNTNGNIDFYEVKNKKYTYLKYNLAGIGSVQVKDSEKFNKNTVATTTLDQFVIENEIHNIDLIKIDTEGTEHLVLEKAQNVLQSYFPIIICETLFNTIEYKLEQIFKSYGYEMYNHVPNGLKKVTTIIRKTDDGISNCFFVHPSKVFLIEEFIVKE